MSWESIDSMMCVDQETGGTVRVSVIVMGLERKLSEMYEGLIPFLIHQHRE